MKKAKLFKIIILILSAVLFAAAAVWLQKMSPMFSGKETSAGSPPFLPLSEVSFIPDVSVCQTGTLLYLPCRRRRWKKP